MTHRSRAAEIGRWTLAAAAATAAYFGSIYFGLFVLIFGPFPDAFAESAAVFLVTSSVIIAGSLVAPRFRLGVAILLAVLSITFIALQFRSAVGGNIAGGLVAVAYVGFWSHPLRTRAASIRVGLVTLAAVLVFSGVLFTLYIDRPARPDPVPDQLTWALGTNRPPIAACDVYDRGGFIDHQWLWRIHAGPDAIETIISGLQLQAAPAVPSRFWRMAPHYWPRSMPADAAAFQSPWFEGETRGPDGHHYFLLHDMTRDIAFVWFKSNF